MPSYELEGLESLGSMLRVVVRNDVGLSNSSLQWFRIQPEGHKKEIISGRTIFILRMLWFLRITFFLIFVATGNF